MTAADAPNLVLPYVRTAFRKKSGPALRLLVGPWLPTLVKIVLDVVVLLTSPALSPLIPVINRFVDWALSSGEITAEHAGQIRSFVALYAEAKSLASPEARTAVANPDPS